MPCHSADDRVIVSHLLAALLLLGPAAAHAQAQYSAPAPAAPLAAPELSPEAAARLARLDELATAIVKDDAKRVAAWIKANKELNFNFDEVYRGRTSQSPLTLAVGRDRVEIARMLIDAGADPGRIDGFGRGAIHYARSAETRQLLAERGADVNAPDRYGRTALASAVERGDLQTVDRLVAGGARLDLAVKDGDLFTLAVQSKRPEMIVALLERGLDPRKPPTPVLLRLIESGDTANAVALLRKGADPNLADARGDTLLTRALFRQRWEIAEALADAGANLRPPDAPGCRHGSLSCQSIAPARLASFNPATLARLTAKGLNLNTVASDGHSAISSLIVDQPMAVRAVGAGTAVGVGQNAATREVVTTTSPARPAVAEIPAPDNAARVKSLLDARADPNLKYQNATPLMLAVALPNKPPRMADVLLEAGGTIEIEAVFVRHDPNKDPPTLAGSRDVASRAMPVRSIVLIGMSVGPLTWAALHGRPDVALRLLARDRKVSRADRHLLYFAAAADHWDLLLAALPHTREIDASDRADVTPLMLAADAGNLGAVKALLAAGASINARSVRSWPPLSELSIGGAIAGHSPAPPRLAGGYTALRAAREKGHAEVVRVLKEAGGRE